MEAGERRFQFAPGMAASEVVEVRMDLNAIALEPLPKPPMILIGTAPTTTSASGLAFEIWGGALSFGLESVTRDRYSCRVILRVSNHSGTKILGKRPRYPVGTFSLTSGAHTTMLKWSERDPIDDGTETRRAYSCEQRLPGELSDARLGLELERDQVVLAISGP